MQEEYRGNQWCTDNFRLLAGRNFPGSYANNIEPDEKNEKWKSALNYFLGDRDRCLHGRNNGAPLLFESRKSIAAALA
jgi:hypothetical protein